MFLGYRGKFRTKPGIISTEVGYAGGKDENVNYEKVCKGNTGHAETVKIEFDEKITSYEKILDLFLKCMIQRKRICNILM